jgi:hypothetical protein
MNILYNYRFEPVEGDDSVIWLPDSRRGQRNSAFRIPHSALGSRCGGRTPFPLESTLFTTESICFGSLSSFRHPQQLDIAGWQEETFPVLISSVHGT